MKVIACLTSLFIITSSVAAAPLDRRDDACPDPLAKIRPILKQLTKPSGSPGQLDFKKVDWTKVMIDSQPLISEIKASLPKLAAGIGPLINDFKPVFADVDFSKLGLPS